MAQRRKRRSGRSKKESEYPGWVWGLWGLTIGLSVAAAVWVSDRAGEVTNRPVARDPASLENALDDNSEREAMAETQTEATKSRFEFYDMLPNFEVIIPETDPEVAADVEPRAVDIPGTYVLQAGSFTSYDDADRRRAQLALQGIESSIQRVSIDDKTFHRVRVGPTNDLDELNMLRSRLRAAKIDVLRIRLGD
jgi:cell division protein FtsN